MKKTKIFGVCLILAVLSLSACSGAQNAETDLQSGKSETKKVETEQAVKESEEDENLANEKGKVNLAAAASLEKTFSDRLIPMFQEKYPEIEVVGTYDSSGKLQVQIEEGAEADVFFSAAMKQMDALREEGIMDESSINKLLKNEIVLIAPKESGENYSKFTDIVNAKHIAIGDPASVPAGQYAKEALQNLGIWEAVETKASFGTNVTEVLNWVAEGSADAGIVYATDAAKEKERVSVIDTAPEGSVQEVIYPVGITKESKNAKAAALFIEFLKTEEALEVFEENGFTAYK